LFTFPTDFFIAALEWKEKLKDSQTKVANAATVHEDEIGSRTGTNWQQRCSVTTTQERGNAVGDFSWAM
jgi:hypothetical protein